MNQAEIAKRLRAAQLLIKSVAEQCHVAGKPGMSQWAKSIAEDTGDLALSVEASDWMVSSIAGADFSDSDITAVTSASWASGSVVRH